MASFALQRFAVVAALAGLGLAGCSDHDELRANRGVCADFKAQARAAADGAAPVDECVRRWAYSLASAEDDAVTVADATVAACSGALSRWNQQALAQPPPAGEESLSITTGQPTNPLAEHAAFAQNQALLYVVQARAGRCAPPPMKDGAPEGLPG